MAHDDDSGGTKFDGAERRKKVRRSGKERRDQARWDMKNPLRRKGPGRREIDRLLKGKDRDR